MRYSTSVDPDETRAGYFLLTATDATAPNQGMTKGYSVFYEGDPTTTATGAEITTPGASSQPLPPAVRQVFDSFELIAAPTPASTPESALTSTTPSTTQTTTAEVPEDYIEFRSPLFGVVISYPPEPQFDDARSQAYSRIFTTLDYLSYLINQKVVEDRRLIDYMKADIIRYYEETFLKHASIDERDSNSYQQFKNLYLKAKK
jgi:hypothetical protein